jgi:hypothetical protein
VLTAGISGLPGVLLYILRFHPKVGHHLALVRL